MAKHKWVFKLIIERESGEVIARAESEDYEIFLGQQGRIERNLNLIKQ